MNQATSSTFATSNMIKISENSIQVTNLTYPKSMRTSNGIQTFVLSAVSPEDQGAAA